MEPPGENLIISTGTDNWRFFINRNLWQLLWNGPSLRCLSSSKITGFISHASFTALSKTLYSSETLKSLLFLCSIVACLPMVRTWWSTNKSTNICMWCVFSDLTCSWIISYILDILQQTHSHYTYFHDNDMTTTKQTAYHTPYVHTDIHSCAHF